MNFSVLPPEVNSTRIFAGAGVGPMLAAAEAWDSLAAELCSAAESFASITSGLATGAWQGHASAAMSAAASPFAALLNTAGLRAAAAAGQAKAVVIAFESAMAATIHPVVVAANRSSLVKLVMSNLLGQNAPAIATIEADYEGMWAQDVAAMAGYHGAASAVASALRPFVQPLQTLGNVAAKMVGAPEGGEPVAASARSLNSAIGLANAGADNIGLGNVGFGNFGCGNSGLSNFGPGNFGNFNTGLGNLGNSNIGLGNAGSSNFGLANTGNFNLGFGNTGNNNIGIGLTGNNQASITLNATARGPGPRQSREVTARPAMLRV